MVGGFRDSMIDQLVRYLASNCGRMFPGWTNQDMRDYVMFHVSNGTLVYTSEGYSITGMLIAWQQSTPTLEPWTWQRNDRFGRFVWVDHFIAKTSEVAVQLFDLIMSRWGWWECSVAGVRKGIDRVYKPSTVKRLLTKAKDIYGNH
jgi:hypothetical protein